MDKDKTSQVPQPTDPSGDESPGIDVETSGEIDTEGHSMLTVELANATHRERVREAERIGRDSARMRESRPRRDGGFLKRLGLR